MLLREKAAILRGYLTIELLGAVSEKKDSLKESFLWKYIRMRPGQEPHQATKYLRSPISLHEIFVPPIKDLKSNGKQKERRY
jgi:hypothetical protein